MILNNANEAFEDSLFWSCKQYVLLQYYFRAYDCIIDTIDYGVRISN